MWLMDFLKKNESALLGSTGVLGAIQFAGQITDYLADGQLDNHEVQQLVMSAASGLQMIIVTILVAYFKLKDANK